MSYDFLVRFHCIGHSALLLGQYCGLPKHGSPFVSQREGFPMQIFPLEQFSRLNPSVVVTPPSTPPNSMACWSLLRDVLSSSSVKALIFAFFCITVNVNVVPTLLWFFGCHLLYLTPF